MIIRNSSSVLLQQSIVDPKIEVNLIGYFPEGESSVIVVKNEDNAIFTVVVDCYELENINKTMELLEENRIEKIDICCWTHPHKDHSLGIDKLFKYFNKKTSVIIPTGMASDNIPLYLVDIYNKIIGINQKGKKSLGVLKSTSDQKVLFEQKYIGTDNNKIDIKVTAITPISHRVENVKLTSTTNHNEFSVMFLMQINDYNLLFTGDVENGTINEVEKEIQIKNVHYLKIPHHCSTTSKNITNIIDNSQLEDMVCATTISAGYKLPNIELFNWYKKQFENTYCSSKAYFDSSNKNEQYGIIKTTYFMDLRKHQVIQSYG